MQTFEDIPVEAPPSCPTCGAAMVYKGGTFGFVHCEWMLLHRTGGWEKNGKIVKEPPPAELGKARRAGLRTRGLRSAPAERAVVAPPGCQAQSRRVECRGELDQRRERRRARTRLDLRRETLKRCPTRAGQRNRGPTPSLPRNIETLSDR